MDFPARARTVCKTLDDITNIFIFMFKFCLGKKISLLYIGLIALEVLKYALVKRKSMRISNVCLVS